MSMHISTDKLVIANVQLGKKLSSVYHSKPFCCIYCTAYIVLLVYKDFIEYKISLLTLMMLCVEHFHATTHVKMPLDIVTK